MIEKRMKIGVVLVTRNRLACLKVALEKYDKQTKRPEYIIVVNNCSTDGITEKYLDEWKINKTDYEKVVIHSDENGGGSGGFYLAEREALNHEAEWIWHADDDAYPDKDALLEIEKVYYKNNEKIAAYSASVKDINNPDCDISYWRKLYKGFIFVRWVPVKSDREFFEVDKFMYLGCVIKKDVLKSVGLTKKDFFIHEDDIEHSLRVRKVGKIIAVRDSFLLHPSWKDVLDPEEINWKYYYTIRNKILSIGLNLGAKYWKSEIFKARVKHLLHKLMKYPRYVLSMEIDAICDGKNNRTGKNDKYLP